MMPGKGVDVMVEKVRAELVKYEHPLFLFEAHSAGETVEVHIRLARADEEVQGYTFALQEREIEHGRFTWTFQKNLYDCLHDYVIEMFTRNPQRDN
jgi:hypothetical protein